MKNADRCGIPMLQHSKRQTDVHNYVRMYAMDIWDWLY